MSLRRACVCFGEAIQHEDGDFDFCTNCKKNPDLFVFKIKYTTWSEIECSCPIVLLSADWINIQHSVHFTVFDLYYSLINLDSSVKQVLAKLWM